MGRRGILDPTDVPVTVTWHEYYPSMRHAFEDRDEKSLHGHISWDVFLKLVDHQRKNVDDPKPFDEPVFVRTRKKGVFRIKKAFLKSWELDTEDDIHRGSAEIFGDEVERIEYALTNTGDVRLDGEGTTLREVAATQMSSTLFDDLLPSG